MRKLAFTLILAVASAGLGTSDRSVAADQQSATNRPKARIIVGPQLERATDVWAIIRWTTNSVKGTLLRYGVVHYGTDPHHLNDTAMSPNRWNPGLPTMIYRVQVDYLQPGTVYYYRVESQNALNVTEGPQSVVNEFKTEQSP